MNSKGLIFSISMLAVSLASTAQVLQTDVVVPDDQLLKNLERVTMPANYASRPLPAKKDNTRVIHFPGIYNQAVWNCNQASSVWTMFTYEINYLRGLNSSLPENQYSPMPVFNMLNFGNPSQGVSYFDSWELVKANGTPGSTDYPTDNQNFHYWMTGYDRYYRAMKNRIDQVFAIDIDSPDGLLTLKHWINDHLDGSQIGGLANFQIGSGDMIIPTIPMDKGLEEEGQYIVIKYGPYVGHAMTFAGWNDSVRYDWNGDGRYTNHIDINGDNVVNMKDWEIGAMLVVNSWGGMYNAGKLWVMYRLLAEKPENGGIWNSAAMVVKPKKTYNPLLTVKAKIRYNERNRIKIQVGIAANPDATSPDKVMDFPCFNYQGDTLPMQGFVGPSSDVLEFGLDISPLMNDLPENGQGRIFLEVVQKSSDTKASGQIESFSVMDYTNGSQEFTSTGGVVPIGRNTTTRLSVPINIKINKPILLTEELPDASVGLDYRVQLEADGLAGPFRYANPKTWFVETAADSPITMTGGTNIFDDPETKAKDLDLPFSFPFYGATYNKITVLTDGGIVMGSEFVKYPYVIDYRLQFYQNIGAFPFYGSLSYPNPTSNVTFEASATGAIVRWHASQDPAGAHPLEFAVQLLSDGSIRFFYGTMNMDKNLQWISGLSAGNNLDYYRMKHSSSVVVPNSQFNLALLDWPSWLSLSTLGNLSGIPDRSGYYNLPFKITDWNGITNVVELTLNVVGGSGIHTNEALDAMRIFPNPVTDITWLEGFTTNPGTLSFTLFDLTGKRLISREFDLPAGKLLLPITETSTLTNGIYIYTLNGIIQSSGKLIKQ
jgi:hypothetical protein